MSWTNIAKPSSSSWTSISKPGSGTWSKIAKPAGSLTAVHNAGTATGLIMSPTYPYLSSIYSATWVNIAKPT